MMPQAEQTAFVKNGLEALYREFEQADPIYLRSCGVPEEMRAGPVDEDGWCKWKLVPSPVTAADLDRLEEKLGCALPSLLRTFLSTYCHSFDSTDLGRQLPDTPFHTMKTAWNPTLAQAGFLPFGWDVDAAYIRCIDLSNMPDEDRCPVVQIDHEFLFDGGTDRAALLPHMEPVAKSFQVFLKEIFSGFFTKKAQELVQGYLDGLHDAYEDADAGEKWDEFVSAAHGAGEKDLDALKALYPQLPASLAKLLCFADGTYYREYRKGEKICLSFLGSDLEEFPYCLLSAKQMVKTKDDFREWGGFLIKREFGDPVDKRITDDPEHLHWLHFADCRNNGGSSQLFIDFSPSEKGTAGQIVRYLHDPDELAVIADSFDEYLELLMENEYDFINEDTVEE